VRDPTVEQVIRRKMLQNNAEIHLLQAMVQSTTMMVLRFLFLYTDYVYTGTKSYDELYEFRIFTWIANALSFLNIVCAFWIFIGRIMKKFGGTMTIEGKESLDKRQKLWLLYGVILIVLDMYSDWKLVYLYFLNAVKCTDTTGSIELGLWSFLTLIATIVPLIITNRYSWKIFKKLKETNTINKIAHCLGLGIFVNAGRLFFAKGSGPIGYRKAEMRMLKTMETFFRSICTIYSTGCYSVKNHKF